MKVGVVVGRFQTDSLHAGHENLIETVTNENDILVVILGCAMPKLTLRDPLDFPTRREMIFDSYPMAQVFKLDDNSSNEIWSENLDKLLNKLYPSDNITLYCSRDGFNTSYTGEHSVVEVKCGDEKYSSTSIREKIYKSDPIGSRDFRAGVIYASYHQYPKVFPTVDAFIFNPRTGKVLLGKRPKGKTWRLFGGFVDPTDDSFEDAVKREVQEEANLSVDTVEYLTTLKINDWRYPISSRDKIFTSLYFCTTDYDGPVTAGDDMGEAQWFDLTEVFEENIDIAENHKKLINIAREYYLNKEK